jgi:predicted DNA-binding protein
MSKGSPQIVVRVGDTMLQQLRSLATENGCSVAEIVRTAIRWYLVDLMQHEK